MGTLQTRSIWSARMCAAAQLVVAGLWIWSGLDKFFNLSEFRETVLQHHVVASGLQPYLWFVPACEVLMGVGIAALGGNRLGRPAVIGIAAFVVLGFSLYVLAVPPPVLKAAGCGCAGAAKIVSVESPAGLLVRNAIFLALHLLAAGPSFVGSAQWHPNDPPTGPGQVAEVGGIA